MYYLGVESRLRALLSDPVIARYMFNLQGKRDASAEVRNIQQSKGWEEHITMDEEFSTGNDGRNIVLSGFMDGFQSFRKVARTLTPIICQILNLPENLRHRAEFIMLVALIPGPREPKNYAPYLKIFVEELNRLYQVGFEMADPLCAGKMMTVRVKLLIMTADLPAFQHMLCQQGASAHDGCFKCHIKVFHSDTHEI